MIVSLPQHAFIPYGSQSKTSILFLRKKKVNEEISKSFIFMAHVQKIGYDATRRAERNDLPSVLDEWEKFRDDPANYPSFVELNDDAWIAKVSSAQLFNKLDVEAYGRSYMKTMERIENIQWPNVRLSEICERIFSGISPDKIDYREKGIPVVKTATVAKITNNVGFIDWGRVEFLSEEKFGNSTAFLRENDILVQSVAHSKSYIADKIAIVDSDMRGGEESEFWRSVNLSS